MKNITITHRQSSQKSTKHLLLKLDETLCCFFSFSDIHLFEIGTFSSSKSGLLHNSSVHSKLPHRDTVLGVVLVKRRLHSSPNFPRAVDSIDHDNSKSGSQGVATTCLLYKGH